MKCGNCGTELIPGNNTCPSCGALNMPLNTPTPPIEQLEESNVQQVDANINVPTLEVKEEILDEFAEELEETTPTETYAPTPEQTVEVPKEDIKIDIPSVSGNEAAPVDKNVEEGGVQDINIPTATVGSDIVVPDKTMAFKIGKKTIKVKMGKFNLQKLVVFVAIFALGLLMGYLFFGNRTTTRCYKTVNSTKNLVSNGKNNETYINGFKYKIPTSYSYDKTDNGLIIYDNDQTFKMYIKSMIFQYTEAANAKLSVQQSLIDSGFAVESIKELIFNEHSYLVINVTDKYVNRMIALTDIGNGNTFYVEITPVDNKYNLDLFNIADDIIAHAEKTGDITSVEKLSIRDISEMLTTTLQYASDLEHNNN